MLADYVLLLFSTTPRRAKGVFNVLRGRRTVSTLFAGLTANCLELLDSWHGVDLETLMAVVATLEADQLLVSTTEGSWQLTLAGQKRQQQLQTTLYQPQAFQAFQTIDVRRFERVSQLALQVISEGAHAEKRYYPVTSDPGVQATVKQWLRSSRQPMTVLGKRLYETLNDFLTTLDSDLATIFVMGLTGYQLPGRTDQQLAEQFDRQPLEIWMIRKDLMCQWVLWIQQHQTEPLWPLLAPLIQATAISQSAWQTYQTFLQQPDVQVIARQRKLKLSTVREHLLETAILMPDFPFERLLSSAVVTQLTTIFQEQSDVASWQFQQAQDQLPELDFFWFRLFQIMRCRQEVSA
ncbi:helix-turn-helix domain-containing protein [Lactiplantibacillus herbarum]|uniref:helix-turn-helix domain-containing protein n=1 Tax=Lactiplantibacillus herbarum TaxID=1670446 RepID=UPI00064F3160|nr:helix-turn-helix domain-containing protein [Lactiplantibacillus herbarum]